MNLFFCIKIRIQKYFGWQCEEKKILKLRIVNFTNNYSIFAYLIFN